MRALPIFATLATFVLLAPASFAQEGEKKEHKEGAAEAKEEKKEERHEEKEEAEEAENEFYADLVVGHTKIGDAGSITDFSILAGLEHEFGGGFALGARLPLVFGTLSSSSNDPNADSSSGGAFTIGNLELEPSFTAKLAEGIHLKAFVGVALPTAQGADETDPSASSLKREFALGAASGARGYYESALFSAGHVGIVPGVSFPMRFDAVQIIPLAKVELLETTSKTKHGNSETELVVGAKFIYNVTPSIGVGIHPWLVQTLSDVEEGEKKTQVVLEPLAMFHVSPNSAVNIGFILPVSGNGAQSDSRTFGGRVGFGTKF